MMEWVFLVAGYKYCGGHVQQLTQAETCSAIGRYAIDMYRRITADYCTVVR